MAKISFILKKELELQYYEAQGVQNQTGPSVTGNAEKTTDTITYNRNVTTRTEYTDVISILFICKVMPCKCNLKETNTKKTCESVFSHEFIGNLESVGFQLE